MTDELLRRPEPPRAHQRVRRADEPGGRPRARRRSCASATACKLFEGTDGLIGAVRSFERSDGFAGGARLETAAGRDPGKPAFVGYRLGDGVVVRVGVRGWAAALDDGDEEAKVTKRIWALLSR